GRTVHFLGAGSIGSALADDGATADERGPACLGTLQLSLGNGAVDRSDIMAVNIADHVPAVAFEAARGVVAKPVLHLAVNGNAIVIVEDDKLGQAQSACQGADLVGNAFHEAAIAHEGISMVIDDLVPFP